jgi:putative ABC transport system permease protein
VRQDLRYCLRSLAKTPGLVMAAMLSLGLGIGLNLTVFGIFEAMFFRGVTAESPEHTFRLWIGGSNRASYPNFRDLQESGAVPQVFGYSLAPFLVGEGEARQRIFGQVVAGDYFEALGITPIHGRRFTGEEKQPEREARVALLSYGYWQQRYGGDKAVLGQSLKLNNEPFTIVGILPATHRSLHGFALDPPYYVPYSGATDKNYGDRNGHPLELAIRTAPHQTREQASAALLAAVRELERLHPTANARLGQVRVFGIGFSGAMEQQGGPRMVLLFLGILSVLTGLILLIACSNIAGLLLARAVNRRREVAVRLAIGAGRLRLMRLFLMEGLLLAAGGLAAAAVLYFWGIQLLTKIPLPLETPIVVEAELNWRLVLYCVGVAVATAVFCSLGPALQATRGAVAAGLPRNIDEGSGRLFSFRNVLVMGQVAVSVLLLVTSLLFVRSLHSVSHAEPGFNVANQLSVRLRMEGEQSSTQRSIEISEEAAARLRSLPGVKSVAMAAMVPLSSMQWMTDAHIDQDPQRRVLVQVNAVSPDYFETMGVRLLTGRAFHAADRNSSQAVAVVNEAFVRQHLAGRDPLGVLLAAPKGRTGNEVIEIVGVVATSKHVSLGEAPTPVMYRPLNQSPMPMMPGIQVRVEGPASQMAGDVRAAVQQVVPGARVEVQHMQEVIESSIYTHKLGAALLGGLGMLGLVLTSVGMYAALSYAVSRRVREIGVRMALGATPRQVLRVVLGQSMAVVGAGTAVGLGLALVATQPLTSFLSSQVRVSDASTLLGVLAVLAVSGLAATYVPASRALRVDPVSALRSD